MSIKVVIENAQMLSEDIWLAKLDPSDVRLFGNSINNFGDISVLIYSSDDFDKLNYEFSTLTLGPQNIKVINVGRTDNTIIIKGRVNLIKTIELDSGDRRQIQSNTKEDKHTNGDLDFIKNLTVETKSLGELLLESIRKEFRGELKYYEKSGKYVETPDNFWTVKIQPRDQSLRITVRGNPDSFMIPDDLSVKPDMSSYSRFKISSINQVESAASIIRQAYQQSQG